MRQNLTGKIIRFHVFARSHALKQEALSRIFPGLFRCQFSFGKFTLDDGMICRKLRDGIRNDICPAIADMADVIPTFHKKNSFHCRSAAESGLFGVVFQPDMKRLDKIVPVIEQLCLWCFLHI